MDFTVLLSPILIYLIYSILSIFHRISIFQIPYNFDKEKVAQYLAKKEYLKNILTVLFDKSTLLDAYGLHFLQGKHSSDRHEIKMKTSIFITLLTVLSFILFVFSVGMIMFFTLPVASNPFLLYTFSIAKFVIGVMIIRSCFSYLTNIVHWFRYKFFVLNKARKQYKHDARGEDDEDWTNDERVKKFDAWGLWFSDEKLHERYRPDFVEKEEAARISHHIPFNIKVVDLIKYISSNRSGTEKIIYFCIFTLSVANSFTLVESYIGPLSKQIYEDETVNNTRILYVVLSRLLFLTVLAYPVMCFFIGIVWLIAKVVFMLSIKGLHTFIEANPKKERSTFTDQFIMLLSLIIKKNYHSLTGSERHIDWTRAFKKELVKNVFVPSGIFFLYGFLFTSVFVIWFESKPGRYQKENDQIRNGNVDDNFSLDGSEVTDRVRRYSLLCKSFIIATGFVVGSMIIFKSCVSKNPLYYINNKGSNSELMTNLSLGVILLLILCILMGLLFY